LLGVFLGFLMLKYFPDWVIKVQKNNELKILTMELKETLLLAIMSAPTAFVLWTYRDKNSADATKNAEEAIQNSRFDTNLKYFTEVKGSLGNIKSFLHYHTKCNI